LSENHPFFLSEANNKGNERARSTAIVRASIEEESEQGEEEVGDDEEDFGHYIGDTSDGYDDQFDNESSDAKLE